MKITITIKRSKEYVAARNLADGTNHPETITVDIDPADLTLAARESILARTGNYPADLICYDSTAGQIQWHGKGMWNNCNLQADLEPEAVTPAIVSSAIEALAAKVASDYAEQTNQEAQKQAVLVAELIGGAPFRSEKPIYDDRVYIDSASLGGNVRIERCPAIEARITAHEKQIAAENAEQKKAAKDTADKTRAAWDKVYSQLAESVRERHAAGYMPAAKVEKQMKSLLRRNAGYGPHDKWNGSDEIDTLTEEEFTIVKAAKAGAPDGADVDARTCYNKTYRAATESDYDDPDINVDRDDEVLVKEDIRRQIVIRWLAPCGIDVVAVVPLPAN